MKVLHSLLATAIASANGSDKNAFWTACYHESCDKLVRTLRSKYKVSYDDALDIVQDTFEKLLKQEVKSLEKYFEKGNKIEGLLWTTTKRLYFNSTKKIHPEALDADGCDQPAYLPPYDGDIVRWLKQISEKEAKAFALSVYGGYSLQEIADQEGVTLSAIKMRISRAKESLKKAFEADS